MNKLIIFDCDGVLVDSEIIANRIDAEMLTNHGYLISTEESIKRFTGKNTKTVHDEILEQTGIRLPPYFADLVNQAIIEAFRKELKPLMLSVLSSSLLSGIDKCVASSSSRDHVILSLKMTKQYHFFDDSSIFSASQVKNGKPAPDLFLLAAKNKGYESSHCIVIEDSVAGIEAALAAGMPVIAFLGGSHANFPWYRESIEVMGVPTAYDSRDLMNILSTLLF
ncbi:MAG: HAD-IA family hydrolase [Legionellales bacterium]|nr:HAD-IA family hydrolase [Legionellales bacterium]